MDEELVSANSSEWIVDGDLFLIKTISRYPILWDRKHFDSDLRNEVWLKLSKKLKIKVEWMKKRWSYLREQYVRHLKQINNLESDKQSKKNYKYFNEMSFLANHIQLRNINFQEAIKSVSLDTSRPFHMLKVEKNEVTDHENENYDFVITENDIEAYNDDDDFADNLFVELSDEEQQTNDECDLSVDLQPPTQLTSKAALEISSISNVSTTQSKSSPLAFEDTSATDYKATEPHVFINRADVVTGDDQLVSKSSETRCEDVIFGELVTSMLKKMDSPNRKRAKKEIMNILLS
ncbi:hypothetical protein Bhyg_10209 [Pseudolycoriella hygida]|uniref:MADF domain-containing protein n=1 Tax=Pseudolycoriella hygida TaxID=35572 RepID=A0A9Q0MUS8_9DIPT|nr:hypothetical protein Bhyg_10209 [Pseudolycoriella hygida]